jgi:outer membrane protein assembly factor BamA
MFNNLQKISAIATTVILSLSAIKPAQSAILTYNLSGTTDSGPLVGETYSGSFSFDDSNLTGNGSEFLTPANLNLNFSNPIFSNATPVLPAELAFFNGTFLGLNLSTSIYSFVPGFFSLNEALFAYQVNQQGGAGSINYTLRQEPAASVPEPTTTIGLLLLGVWGISKKLERKIE